MSKKNANSSPAEKKQRFIKHFRVYLVMSIFFVGVNVVGGSNYFWAIWPILGWGIGVAMEGLSVYGPLRDRDNEYEADEEYFDLNKNRPDRKAPLRQDASPQSRGFREEDLV